MMKGVICVMPEGRGESGVVADWLEDFYRRTGKRILRVDPETREGEGIARSYDVTMYPTVIALDGTGRVREVWRGMPLPRLDEVGFYMMGVKGEEEGVAQGEDMGKAEGAQRPVGREGKRLGREGKRLGRWSGDEKGEL